MLSDAFQDLKDRLDQMPPHRFTSLISSARRLLAKSSADDLPAHPYEEQFSPDMDCPYTHWATRFVLIASTPRCGSHFLGHMLGATGQCGVPLEYLNKLNKKYWALRFGTDRMDDLFPRIVQHRTSENGTFTLKAHWKQFHPFIDKLDSLTRGLGVEKTIWILRRDQLAQAISKVIAAQTGVWISGATPTGTPRYDYDAIVRSAEANRRSNLYWRAHLAPFSKADCLTLIYEDIVSDATILDEVSVFLDLDAQLRPAPRTRKQGDMTNSEWRDRFMREIRDRDRWILEPADGFAGPAHQKSES